jgi:predicted DNA-binding protein (MmcQ/YjbR family)
VRLRRVFSRSSSRLKRQRFFRPPYVGARGWLGVRLDRKVDWDEIAAVCKDAYRTVVPKKLAALLDLIADA